MISAFINLINDLPWAWASLIVIFVFVFISLFALFMARRFIPAKALKGSHDVAGFTFGIIGMIYAVLLGFTVVEVNNRFHDAEMHMIKEATIMSELFRDTLVFPKGDRDKLQQLIREYTIAVRDDEWEKMGVNQESQIAKQAYYNLWGAYAEAKPSNEKELAWYNLSLERMNELSVERVTRLFNTQQYLGPLMWTLLLGGAFITIFFMLFFFADSVVSQAIMTGLLSGIIAFMLFLIMSLEGIYDGDIRVRATEFKKSVNRFDEMMQIQMEK